MFIDLRTKQSEIPTIPIDNIPIERTTSRKLLGIWIESDFKWHKNVLKKYGAPAKDLLTSYCSVIRSLWHGYLKNSKNDLKYEEALATFKLSSLKRS